jgi:hypothetical protein
VMVEENVIIESGNHIHAAIQITTTEVDAGGEAVVLEYPYSNADFISWSMGDGALLQGSDSISYTYQGAGEYRVVLTVARGNCSDTASVAIRVNDPTGIQEANSKQIIHAFPNPARNYTRIQCGELSKDENLTLHLIDRSGKIVRENYVEKGTMEIYIPLNDLPSGRYELLLSGKSNRITGSIQVIGQ